MSARYYKLVDKKLVPCKDVHCARYETYEEAEQGHAEAVALVYRSRVT